jgi:outer membrane protein W
LGLALQVGGAYYLTHRWFIDTSMGFHVVSATTNFSNGQKVENTLNPLVLSFSLGGEF